MDERLENPGLLAPPRKGRKQNRLVRQERDITNEVQLLAPPPSLDTSPDDIGAQDDLLDEAEALTNVLGELDASIAGAVVKIWRVDRMRKENAFIDEIVPQEFTLKWLKDEHGGGVYRVRVYVPQRDDDGMVIPSRVKLTANKQIIIDGAPRVKRDEPGALVPAQNNELLLMGFTKMAEAMHQGFSQLAQQNKQPGVTELLQQMMLMKQVMGGDRPSVDPMVMLTNVMKMSKEMSEFSTVARGGDDDGGSVGGAVMWKLFEKVMEGINKMQSPGGPQPDPAPLLDVNGQPLMPAPPLAPVTDLHPPLAAPLAGSVQTPAPTTEDSDDMNTLIMKAALADVLKHAERNTPPAEYAASVFDTLPDSVLDFLEQDDWLATLKAFDERAARFPMWLQAVRDELLRLDKEDEASDAEPDTPGGG